jgi:hypothetical protein
MIVPVEPCSIQRMNDGAIYGKYGSLKTRPSVEGAGILPGRQIEEGDHAG